MHTQARTHMDDAVTSMDAQTCTHTHTHTHTCMHTHPSTHIPEDAKRALVKRQACLARLLLVKLEYEKVVS